MVFKKKWKPKFTREELEGMLEEQNKQQQKEKAKLTEPIIEDIEPVEIIDDEMEDIEMELPKPRGRPPTKVPKGKIISQEEANKEIAKEEKETEETDLEYFKKLSLQEQALMIEQLQELYQLRMLFEQNQKAEVEYGAK